MRPRTHIFAVAIENYQDPSFQSVVYAEQDAQAFVEAWKELGASADECVTLEIVDATLADLRAKLHSALSRVEPGDRFVMYFSGHVKSIHGTGRIIAQDTTHADADDSSLPFVELLDKIREANCQQVLLFLDGSRSLLPALPGADVVLENEFPTNECQAFCKESATRFVFVSCKPKEISHASGTLDHGIWSHCLIRALRAEAKESLDKDQRVTTQTLQAYLLAEVPRILRVTVAGAVKQTPVLIGSKTKELLIADHAERLHQKQLAVGGLANPIKDSCLTGEIRGRVRELRGYAKPKTSLATHNDWERDFVEKAGTAEVTALATEIFEQLREAFRYKRKDLSFTNIASTASIKGPDFDVNISLSQDPEDAERFLLSTEVRSFRNAEVINDPHFLSIFTKYCKRIEFELEANLDLESKIDDIEEIDALAANLDYDPECSEFTLKLPQAGINIYASGARMIFSLDAPGDLKLLLGNAQKAFQQLSGNQINLGVRAVANTSK